MNVGGEFVAKYRTPCGDECGTLIEPGDMVAFNEDDKVAHLACPGESPVGKEHPVCQKCFLVHPPKDECPW